MQLLDDIQDVKEDYIANTKTIFSYLQKHDLGLMVNKTIHFGRMAMEEMRCFKRADESGMIPLMNKSIESMIIESAGMNPDAFTSRYLMMLERYSPLSFDFIRKIRTRASSERFSVFRKYFEKEGLDKA